MTLFAALVGLLLIPAQDIAETDRVMNAVRAVLAPALPFPTTDASGSLPAGGETEPLWMVLPLKRGETSMEILANPLNALNQVRATKAMADIERNIAAAQRRAENQYERAIAEAKRTGKSQEVDGVTLADEGSDGEKIDAESHVVIDVLFKQDEYRLTVTGRTEPTAFLPFPHTHLEVAAHAFKETREGSAEHYKEFDRIVFLGSFSPPQVTRRTDTVFDVVARSSGPGLVIRMRGNMVLINQIFAKADWDKLAELLK